MYPADTPLMIKRAQEERRDIPNPEEFIHSDFSGVLFVSRTATIMNGDSSDIS
jgi:hypothetical protein